MACLTNSPRAWLSCPLDLKQYQPTRPIDPPVDQPAKFLTLSLTACSIDKSENGCNKELLWHYKITIEQVKCFSKSTWYLLENNNHESTVGQTKALQQKLLYVVSLISIQKHSNWWTCIQHFKFCTVLCTKWHFQTSYTWSSIYIYTHMIHFDNAIFLPKVEIVYLSIEEQNKNEI